MDWRARVGDRTSSEGGSLRVGFLGPQDTERVFDACSGAELQLELKLQMRREREYPLEIWVCRDEARMFG